MSNPNISIWDASSPVNRLPAQPVNVFSLNQNRADPSLKASPYMTLENAGEMARLETAIKLINEFYTGGIQKLIKEHALIMRDEIRETAPYDWSERDNYHMKDHMVARFYMGGLGAGWEVESEADYSGLLEYGTANHGVQHVFFRPTVERGQREYKKDCIRIMTDAITGKRTTMRGAMRSV